MRTNNVIKTFTRFLLPAVILIYGQKVIAQTAGGMKGASKGKQAQAQQNQQAQANAVKTQDQMKQDFQKAFSVCIEGKGYTIK